MIAPALPEAQMTDCSPSAWFVYVLASDEGSSTYVGITNDLERRLAQHNGYLPGGARATRRFRPWRVARTLGPFATRSAASKCEYALKRVRGAQRLRVEFQNAP